MPGKTGKREQKRPLSHTRPRNFSAKHNLSSKKARVVINKHHNLTKALLRAETKGDVETVNLIQAELEDAGGIKAYQRASQIGQSKLRGGDSSKVLVDWVTERNTASDEALPEMTLLEVGALSCENACSTSGIFSGGVTRIDLHSKMPEIERQDFMKRPEPVHPHERFDCVSLSLVLNYVPEPIDRGEMLRRAVIFLKVRDHERQSAQYVPSRTIEECFPSIFIVLPAPCMTNSRYFNESKLEEIMQTLECTCIRKKQTSRLAYYLFRYNGTHGNNSHTAITKQQVRTGKDRNNFTITLTHSNPKGMNLLKANQVMITAT